MKPIYNLFLSIGAMKSGTSWLYRNLSSHPMIDCVPVKEVHYFYGKNCEDYILSEQSRIDSIRYNSERLLSLARSAALINNLDWCRRYLNDPTDDDWFANLFSKPQSEIYCADFSNLNFILPSAGWEHVLRASENRKIMLTLRDPLSRLWSHVRFQANWSGCFDSLQTMSPSDFTKFISDHSLWKFSRYSETISTVREKIGDNDLMIADYHAINQDPQSLLEQVFAFLGISSVPLKIDSLADKYNVSRPMQIPDNFRIAARDLVEGEMQSLKNIGFSVPYHWNAA